MCILQCLKDRFLMRLKVGEFESESGAADERIAVSGGGASSATWMQSGRHHWPDTLWWFSSSVMRGPSGARLC
jgi:hypothetical protein